MGRLVRRRIGLQILVSFVAIGSHAAEPICASSPAEFALSSALSPLSEIFPENSKVGYVNETAGSYFEIESGFDDQTRGFTLTFYTSGFLDLYGVMRTGPAKFCLDQTGLTVHGMGQIQKIQVLPGRLILGEGGPRKTFTRGSMPLKLVELHRPPGTGGSRTQQKGFANPSQHEEH